MIQNDEDYVNSPCRLFNEYGKGSQIAFPSILKVFYVFLWLTRRVDSNQNMKRIIFTLSLLSLFGFTTSFAQERTKISSDYLSPKIKDPYVISSEEEMGLLLFGVLPGQTQPQKLGRILTKYSDEPTRVNIDEVNTEEVARGMGVATTLYDIEIKSHEDYAKVRVTHLAGTPKVGTNKDAVLIPLIKALSDKGGFREPNPKNSLEEQFIECCEKIYDRYPAEIESALKNSPTVKIGAKLGFTLDPKAIEFEVYTSESSAWVHINYVQVRK